MPRVPSGAECSVTKEYDADEQLAKYEAEGAARRAAANRRAPRSPELAEFDALPPPEHPERALLGKMGRGLGMGWQEEAKPKPPQNPVRGFERDAEGYVLLRDAILEMKKKNPCWKPDFIAQRLGCRPAHVSNVLRKANLLKTTTALRRKDLDGE